MNNGNNQGSKVSSKSTFNARQEFTVAKPQLCYEAPVLIEYGDVRDITLGGSQNSGDPGVPASSRRNF